MGKIIALLGFIVFLLPGLYFLGSIVSMIYLAINSNWEISRWIYSVITLIISVWLSRKAYS